MVLDALLPERAVVGAAADGDEEAFADLVNHYGPQLHRYARATLRDAGAADEVVQDAFVSAWQHLPNYRGDSSLRTWLFAILSRKICDHRRRRVIATVGDGMPDWPDDGRTDPFAAVSARDFMADLRDALAELPYRQRACWLLREVEDMSYPEIAVVTGLSDGAARGHVTRARTTLSARLTAWR